MESTKCTKNAEIMAKICLEAKNSKTGGDVYTYLESLATTRVNALFSSRSLLFSALSLSICCNCVVVMFCTCMANGMKTV